MHDNIKANSTQLFNLWKESDDNINCNPAHNPCFLFVNNKNNTKLTNKKNRLIGHKRTKFYYSVNEAAKDQIKIYEQKDMAIN